jgi:hypothetical protein
MNELWHISFLNDLKGFYSNQALKNTENEQVPHLIEQIGSGSFKFGIFC